MLLYPIVSTGKSLVLVDEEIVVQKLRLAGQVQTKFAHRVFVCLEKHM